MLQQTQSRPNHTSYRNFHFIEFVANALRDNIGSKKTDSNSNRYCGQLGKNQFASILTGHTQNNKVFSVINDANGFMWMV